jgi:hypothetical protein
MTRGFFFKGGVFMTRRFIRHSQFNFLFFLFFFLFLLDIHAGLSAEIKLAWDPNSESDLAGYKVYYGSSARTGTDPKVCVLCGYGKVVPVGKVTTFTISDLANGEGVYVSVTAIDNSNNESAFSNEVNGAGKDSALNLPLFLKAGPNLISFPTLSGQTAVEDLFSPISGQYKTVYGYKGCDGNDPWKMYDPSLPSFVNDLQYIDSTMGVWIEMKQDSVMNVSGAFPTTLGIPLCPGWNLFSYAGNQPKEVVTALSSISGKFERIYCYKSSDVADPWKLYDPSLPPFVNDLTIMEPGLGYWIYMKEACNLVINN